MADSLTAVIIHGTGGSPEGNWFPWLKDELKAREINTVVPQFPTTEGQSIDSWFKVFDTEIGSSLENLILIGHSIGAAMALNVLNRSESKVRATFLVAGFLGMLGNDFFDSLNKTFFDAKFDWKKIVQNAGEVFLYAGDNDPYVPFSKGIELAKNLDTELIVCPGGGI